MDWRLLITIAVSLWVAGVVWIGSGQEKIQLKANKLRTVLLILLIAGIVISSYDILDSPPSSTNLSSLLLTYLHNRWVAFIIIILIKTFFVYWIIYFVCGMFNPGKIAKTVTKVFGIEFSQELTPEKATKAQKGYERLDEQLETLTGLNKEIASYLSTSFEKDILENSYEKAFENLKDKTKKILLTAYASIKGIRIYAIPADKRSINQLEEKLAAIVEVTWNGKDIATINQKVGVIAYSMVSGLETIIIIDPRAGEYELTDAEVWSISGLLASFVSIIGWALQSNLNQSET